MAHARPESTPNPDALKFVLDVTLPERLLANRGDDDVTDPFARALLAIDGVASVFGINDFVTVTRERGADWGAIAGAVEDAAVRYLPSCPGGPSAETVDRARGLLREAVRKPTTTVVEIQTGPRHQNDA
jgi:Scaffold protein Nfu/NifU N terminal